MRNGGAISLKVVLPLSGLLLFAGAWQLLAAVLNTAVLPSFTTTVSAFVHLLARGSFLSANLEPSIVRVFIGFGIAAVSGIGIGIVVGASRTAAEWTGSIIDFMRSIPIPILVPLAIIVFGLGNRMIIAMIAASVVWPVVVNTADGVREIEPLLLETAQICGFPRVRLYVRILLPAALPAIVASLRVALGMSLAVLVVAEMLGGTSGIGYFVVASQQSFNVVDTYAGVMVLAVLGLLFDSLFLLIERNTLRWTHARLGERSYV